jgi:hypothetical protein
VQILREAQPFLPNKTRVALLDREMYADGAMVRPGDFSEVLARGLLGETEGS